MQDCSLLYFRTFATQYIAFFERDPELASVPLTMDEIIAYGKDHSRPALADMAQMILNDEKKGYAGLMWDTAYRAPHRVADIRDQRILVIIDEFQYLSTNIYARQVKPNNRIF